MSSIKREKLIKKLFKRLENVLDKRKEFSSANKIFQQAQQIYDDGNCTVEYLDVFKVFDDLLFDGNLLKCLKEFNFSLQFFCGTRKNKFSNTAQTSLQNNIFLIEINLPQKSETSTRKMHVGKKECAVHDHSCTTHLLAHEFIHVLEIFIRKVTGVNDGFFTNDNKNSVFFVWLHKIFEHFSDKNVL
jgi:hypothetical protein